jgi:uncharacterized membrane protein
MKTISVQELGADRPAIISLKPGRVESIDLLRGVVMIIMALDHVRDYFHYDAFYYSPTDLSQTSVPLFFTRWITHYCAPVFVFLAGISAYLSGKKKSRKELSFFLVTRGIWLVLVELFIISLFRSFNPGYPYLNLQVIWAIGISMIVMSALVYLNRNLILLTGILLITTHNLLDNTHVPGSNFPAVLWSMLHDPGTFTFGSLDVYIRYPVLPWIGVMMLGYYLGSLYSADFDSGKRKKTLLLLGVVAIILFMILRSGNLYGDAAKWSEQRNGVYSFLSFLNVTKYSPSLLYILITLGPALVLLALIEKPINRWTRKIVVFGQVPMFYYLAHILLIHILAAIAALLTGYSEMVVLYKAAYDTVELKGYGFNLLTVYIIWIGLIMLLYPFCTWFARYKKTHSSEYRWLSYL